MQFRLIENSMQSSYRLFHRVDTLRHLAIITVTSLGFNMAYSSNDFRRLFLAHLSPYAGRACFVFTTV